MNLLKDAVKKMSQEHNQSSAPEEDNSSDAMQIAADEFAEAKTSQERAEALRAFVELVLMHKDD